MALHAKNLILLLLVAFFTSLPTKARESKFFTKAVHYHINEARNITQEISVPRLESPAIAPSVSLAPSPTTIQTPESAPAPAEAGYGYGLYGENSSEYSPETVTPDGNEVPDEEFTTESYMKAEENGNPTATGEFTTESYKEAQENANPTREFAGESYLKADENAVSTGEFTTESYMKAEENGNPTAGLAGKFTTESYLKADENAVPTGEFAAESYREAEENRNPTGEFTTESYLKADENAVPAGEFAAESYREAEENVNPTGEFTTESYLKADENAEFAAESYMKADENVIPIGEFATDESYIRTRENEIQTDLLGGPSSENKYNGNGYKSTIDQKNGYGDKYNDNGYAATGRQGLFDTRFLENGKYYYDVKNENYFQKGYEPVRGNGNSNEQGYYSNNEGSNSKYEFGTMEEYERKEGYPQRQRAEYIP